MIRWRETGGPAARAPDGSDFGRDLIETGLRERIGAAGSIRFGADGIRAEIAVPLASGLVLPPPSGSA